MVSHLSSPHYNCLCIRNDDQFFFEILDSLPYHPFVYLAHSRQAEGSVVLREDSVLSWITMTCDFFHLFGKYLSRITTKRIASITLSLSSSSYWFSLHCLSRLSANATALLSSMSIP